MSKVPELNVSKSQNRCAYYNIKKFLRIPYTYLIFQSGQIKILGQADTYLFSTKNGLSIRNVWHKKRISEFSAKNNVYPPSILILILIQDHVFPSLQNVVSPAAFGPLHSFRPAAAAATASPEDEAAAASGTAEAAAPDLGRWSSSSSLSTS